MESSKNPDELIQSLGGCGRFQIRMSIIIHVMKTLVSFSMSGMIYILATPQWQCADDIVIGNQSLWGSINMTVDQADNGTVEQSCYSRDGTCTHFIFEDNMRTAVSEFSLVCNNAWIPATLLSIQLSGMCIGNFVSGQIADLIGRKKPIIISLILLITFNTVSYFASTWVMFAVARFFIGLGCAFFLTVQYPLLSEFTLARWRTWIVGFPSWSLHGCLLALVLWLVKDWKTFCLIIALFGIPFIGAWWVLPESFRWYLAHDRVEDARSVVKSVAKVNKREVPDISSLLDFQNEPEPRDRKYTLIDLFRSRYLVKMTLLSIVNWFGLGFISYGVAFGISALSGSIFLNLFLVNLIAIPFKWITMWIQNRFGRRKTAIICYSATGISTVVVGVVQYIDTDKRDVVVTVFAMMANAAIGSAWTPVQTMTIEVYPTVVRNIGFGFLSTIGRIAAVIGPQLVYLSEYVPGLMYFVAAAIAGVCCICLLAFPETKDANLRDKITKV